MTLTPEEARGALADIDQASRRMRNAVAAGSLGPNLMIWGLVWAIGFGCGYFWPAYPGTTWGTLCTAGAVATAIASRRQYRQRAIISHAEKVLGLKMGIFWITIFAYATGLVLLWKPTDGRDMVVIFVCFAMMAYIIMGLWLGSLPLIFTGLTVTAATVVGRVFLPGEYFLAWMAVFGGGGLFFPGLYVQLRWR